MMAPERYAELTTAASAGSPGISYAAQADSGAPDAGPPLQWPYRSGSRAAGAGAAGCRRLREEWDEH